MEGVFKGGPPTALFSPLASRHSLHFPFLATFSPSDRGYLSHEPVYQGKTSLVRRMLDKSFREEYVKTFGFDISVVPYGTYQVQKASMPPPLLGCASPP